MKRSFDNIKNQKSSLRYDFLPPMQEIIERPSNKLGTFIIWLILVIMITALVWAYNFKLDILVSANGHIVPENGLAIIKAKTTGNIQAISVDESDMVHAGDTILSIDQSEIQLQLDKLIHDKDILEVQYDMYTKLSEDVPTENIDTSVYGDYESIAKSVLTEHDLYLAKLKEYEDAVSKGGSIEQDSVDRFILENDLSILQNINSLKIKLYETENNIERLKNEQEKCVARSPISGKITQLQYRLPGVYITSGETIAYVIPENSEMLFEAYVLDKDIGDIHLNDNVKVRLSLYNDTEDEVVEGIVRKISDVAVSVQGTGNVYTVDISLTKSDGLDGYIGTEGRCDIVVGTRSVLNYFLEPFRKGIQNSLKEK